MRGVVVGVLGVYCVRMEDHFNFGQMSLELSHWFQMSAGVVIVSMLLMSLVSIV